MQRNAELARIIELTPENWRAEFGADGTRDYMLTSVTILRDGKEVVVSNQEKRRLELY